MGLLELLGDLLGEPAKSGEFRAPGLGVLLRSPKCIEEVLKVWVSRKAVDLAVNSSAESFPGGGGQVPGSLLVVSLGESLAFPA